jgi:electron transfer flavoprotein beta subunit
MNEPDAYALEEALRLKEKHGGEVVVCSAGPARVAQVIREALARGADRAIHVEDEALGAADAFAVAGALAAAIKDEQFDLVLTGLQSDDQGFAQVGVVLAERLGMPHATIIMEVQVGRRRPAGEARARGRLVPVGGDAAAGAADHPERHQPAALRHAQGHHGGEEEGDPQGGVPPAGRRAAARSSASTPREAKQTEMIAGSPGEAAARAGAAAARRGAGDL